MGACFFYRRDAPQLPLERIYMLNDDWGQYGNKKLLQQYNKFRRGYVEV